MLCKNVGMLSKSRGLVLRVAAVLHVLFHIDCADPLSDQLSDMSIKAAVNFIQIACQQTAYIAGRGTLQEEVQKYKTGMCYHANNYR